jgi:RecB family exonuclease
VLPSPATGLTIDFLAALGDHCDLHLLIEHSGVGAVDAEMAAFVRRFGVDVAASLTPIDPPDRRPITIVSTTDADEEVRAATREVVAATRAGVPFARMAVVWPVDQPYARLVEHHFDAAGIPWNGRPGTLVPERLVPRFLLDLLELDRRGLRRNDLFDFLADVPVRGPSGHRVSVARWERLARSAGVTRDEHWQPRLASLAASLRARPEPRDADADAADELAGFVADLRRDLGPRRRRRTWAEWVEWCERQVLFRLGRSVLDQLDEAERLASDHTNKVLDRLRHLDGISGPVDRRGFRDAFAAEFEGAPGRLGRLGQGITIGSLAGTIGLDADLTIVLGAADGLLPPPPASDPLVSESDRLAGGLAGADARVHRIHRSLIGHLTTSSRAVITAPRGDLRATAERLPSRWITTHAPDATEHVVNSHHAGVVEVPFPATAAEHRLRARATAAMAGDLAAACGDDVAATRGLALRAARRSDRVTEYDGDLSGVPIDHFDRPMSPSQIEAWPACPHGYFMRYLLRVHPLDDPADDLALSPIERGNVIHETLDRFHRLVVAGELPQPGPDGWSAEHLAAVLALYDEVADEFERTGRTGRAAHWFLDRRSVRNELQNWFVLDGRTAAGRGARVVHSELRFGYDEPVTLPLPDGRRLPVGGFVDRVDQQQSGGLIVTDHKTGSASPYSKIEAADPTENGTKFQLPVYAAAALALHGERPESTELPVLAEYDFFARGRYARHGYTFDADVWAQVTNDLGQVIAGVESGLYPSVTEPPKFEFYIRCHYCQPDGLGVDERYAEWAVKRDDPRLATWFGDEDDG